MKSVWVAQIYEDGGIREFTLHTSRETALAAAANMMTEIYCPQGNACEGDDPVIFETIVNYRDIEGLTLIIWKTDGFFPGAAEAQIYEKDVLV